MHSFNKPFITITLVLFASLTFFFFKPKNPQLPLITITQIIDHDTLNTVRQGLIDGLKENGFIDDQTLKIIFENAHGNIGTASQIATKFENLSPAVMIALSTPSAQTLLKVSLEKKIPLVFSAVTDPIAAKLITDMNHPNLGATGVADFMPALPQLEMIRNFVPKLKKLGVLYNPSEVNSVSYLEHVKKAAAAIGIDLVMAPLNNTSEAATATTSLMGKVDAIYFPNDNTAMAAVGAIVTVALKDKIPVFANDSASVEKGALAALAYNRYEMGRQTAVVVMQLLQGKHPEDIPVVQETPKEVVLNMKTLEKLQLMEPVLADTVRKIY